MKKFIIASMVAIAMLVEVQPVFAAQFIVPEVSASDSQCYVLDLPIGARAEAPEYTASWQVVESTEVQLNRSQDSDWFWHALIPAKFTNLGGVDHFYVSVDHDQSSDVTMTVVVKDSNGSQPTPYPSTFPAHANMVTTQYVTVPVAIEEVYIYGSGYASGTVTLVW